MTFVTGARGVFWGVRETSVDVNLLGAARSAEVADTSAEAKQFYTKLRQIASNAGPELLRNSNQSVAGKRVIRAMGGREE